MDLIHMAHWLGSRLLLGDNSTWQQRSYYHYKCMELLQLVSLTNIVHTGSSWRNYSDSLQGRKVYHNSLFWEKCLHCLGRSSLETNKSYNMGEYD